MQLYDGPVCYISHHESSSKPLRIFFNTSAKYKGQCLNGWCAKGPDANNLCGVLFRFRQERIAFADVTKMYHAVKLTKTEQT